jgi:ABC-type antimicrobial peptide transport system permease subunit
MNDGDAVEVYWPAQAEDLPAMTLVVKTLVAPNSMGPKIRSVSDALDQKLFPAIWLLKSGFHETASDLEKLALIVSLLGVVAISMAGIGILGLVSYVVAQQTKELAIRIALGAKHVQALRSILRQFSWPLILGVLTGAGMAMGLTKMLRKTLYGVSNLDPVSYLAAISVLLLIAGLAALVPARRIFQLNLSKTLHYQ